MAAIAILLTVRAHGGSYTLAGGLSAVYAVSAAIGGPILGRLIDRTRQGPILVGSATLSAAAFTCFAIIDPVSVPIVAIGSAAIAGAATPQLEPCLRVLWTPVLRDERAIHVAYSLDAAAQELVFVTGPLAVFAATATTGEGSGLIVAGVLGLLGSLWFATARPSREWRGCASAAHWAGPLRSRGLVRLLLGILFVGATIGVFTVGSTAYAGEIAATSSASWFIAANAGGALIGGIAYTMASTPDNQHRRLRGLLGALAIGYAPLLIQPGLVATSLLAIVSGLALPSVLACSFALIGQLAPHGTITEAHAWMITAFGAGNAAGSALAGALADSASSRIALATSVLAGFAALGAILQPLDAPSRQPI